MSVSSATAPTKELLYRFSCPACGHRLTIAVRRNLDQLVTCTKCSAESTVPPLDPGTSGFEDVVRAVHATVPPPPPAPVKARIEEMPVFRPAIVADPVVGRSDYWRYSLPWRARWTWHLIFSGVILACSFVVGARPSQGAPPPLEGLRMLVAVFAVAWLIFLGRLLTPYLVERCHSTITCPGCHEVHEARGMWLCGCGFKSHLPRHLLAKCPGCGERPGRTDCPRCGVTIQVA